MEDDSENDTSLSRHHLAHHRTTHHSLLNHHRRTRTATLTNVPGAAHAGVGPATDAPGSQPPVGPATTTATGAAAANSHIGVVISSDSESGATTPGGGAMPVGVGGSAGVDDAGILLLDGVRVDNNDDFAMGAPPGAPGALPLAAVGVGAEEGGNESNREDDDEQDESRTREADEGRTPRPSVAGSGPSASAGWYHAHHPHPHHHMRRRNTVDAASAPDVTPRAALVGLPLMAAEEDFTSTSSQPAVDDMGQPVRAHQMMGHSRNATIRQGEIGALTGAATASASGLGVFASSSSASTTPTPPFASTSATTAADPSTTATSPPPPSTTAASLSHSTSDDATTTNTANASSSNSSTSGSSTASSSPYRDEDVLLALQLLAYLSKYPHVRQAFYKPRVTFHPASVHLTGARFGGVVQTSAGQQAATQLSLAKEKEKDKGSKKDKEKAKDVKASSSASSSTASTSSSSSTIVAPATTGPPSAQRMTNVFSLVERFTYKPSSSASANGDAGGQVQTKLPTEIQYWAGVIMRNACRKDDSRGGIRQCANMLCGKWESFPREFAKCRRCRKAKYCGKECQSTAWSEGHRFWCSAKDAEEDTGANGTSGTGSSRRERERERGDRGDREREREGGEIGVSITGSTGPTVVPVQGGTTTGTGTGTGRRRERDRERERERTRRSANATGATILPSPPREDAPPTTMGIHEQIRASLPPTSPSPSPSPGPSGSGVQQRRSESPTPPASGSRTTSSSSNPRRHSAQPPVPSRAEGPNSPTSITGPSINNHTGIPLPFYPTMATMEGRRAYASSVLASYAGMGLGWLQQVQPSAQGSGSGSGSGSTLTATSASAPTGGGSGGVRLPPLYGSTPGAGSPISVPHFTQQQQQQQQPPQGYGPGGQVIPHAARFSGPVAALHSASGSGSGSGTRAAASVPAASGSSSSSSSPSGASASARRYPFGGTTGAGGGGGFLSMRSPPPSVPDDDDDDQAASASASSGRGAAGNGATYLYPQSRARGGPSADVGSHGGRSRFVNVVEIEGEAEGEEEDGMMLG